jgi:ABC-type lipoprotein export system ATPase subunit
MLQIRNIRKTYSTGKIRVEALKGISLDFPEKGLVFIVGKSGSGKSTLLNIIGGLDKMTSGEIVIDGKSTSNFSSSDFDAFRNYYIGFIFQDFNLIDEINVYDNIALALKIQAKGHDNNTIEDSLKMVGLEG